MFQTFDVVIDDDFIVKEINGIDQGIDQAALDSFVKQISMTETVQVCFYLRGFQADVLPELQSRKFCVRLLLLCFQKLQFFVDMRDRCL